MKEYRYGSGAIAIAQAINDLPKFIEGLAVDYFIVMDNHIHIIFVLEDCVKSLGQIVRAMKYNITKIVSTNVAVGLLSHEKSSHSNATATNGGGIWQWNYYEHIIRNEKSLAKIREYIQNNPDVEKLNWNELDPIK